MAWRHLRVRTKLWFCILFQIALVSGLSAWTFSTTRDVARSSTVLRERTFVLAEHAHRMKLHVVQVQQWLTDIGATRGLDGLDDGFAEAEGHYRSFGENLAAVRAIFAASGDGASLAALSRLEQQGAAYYAVGRRMAQGYVDGGPAVGNRLMGEFDTTAAALAEELDPFIAAQALDLEQRIGGTVAELARFQRSIAVACGAALAVLCLLGFVLARGITVPLAKDLALAQAVAAGDLTARVALDQRDEFGQLAQALNGMVGSLAEMLGDRQ